MSVTKFDAIHSLVGGQLAGDPDGKKINYIDGQKPPTEKAITDEIAKLEVSTKWEDIRRYRNDDLASSDWTILDDSPLASSKKLEWQVYRQKLRDIPKDNDDPDNIEWPTKP